MSNLIASLRVAVASMLVCVLGYSAAVLVVAQLFPDTALGSLVTAADGKVIGSRLIGQNFSGPRYFWPRPSAAGDGYDGTRAAGSNLSPTSGQLTARAQGLVAHYGATPDNPLPADLAAASGGGLDPHISLQAALFQAPRVAAVRNVAAAQVDALIRGMALPAGGFLAPDSIVNVLELNLALDRAFQG